MKQYKNADKPVPPPEDFPRFVLGDKQRYSELARNLMWQHALPYGPEWDVWLKGYDGFPMYPELPSGPKATLWDGWMCQCELWPAVETDDIRHRMQTLWKKSLLTRQIGPDGYVETRQGVFYTHNRAWPFPLWTSGDGGFGWHFSFHNQPGEHGTPNGMAFSPKNLTDDKGFTYYGFDNKGVDRVGLHLSVNKSYASFTTPDCRIDTRQTPFIQIRWYGENISDNEPYLEWQTENDEDYTAVNKMYFTPCPNRDELKNDEDVVDRSYPMLPLYRHPGWKGIIKKLRVSLGNREPGGALTVIALFSHYDTRHNINNTSFLKGCADYFNQTRDLDFLRRNITRMRLALRGFMHDHHALEENVVKTTWVGHDGTSPIRTDSSGKRARDCSGSIPNNWLDILPYGYYDAYATAYYYDALGRMIDIEKMILKHPEWNIEEDYLAYDPDFLISHREDVRKKANELFFNDETGRFVSGIDIHGITHDVGNILSNLEILHSGLSTEEHFRSVMDWISGRRIVDSDAAQGPDIYRYTFAPLINTVDNRDYWFFGYNADELKFGEQIQNGGTALAFSYFDLMARIKAYRADDAWQRLVEILDWYDEVCRSGGYKPYYESKKLNLQGGNVGGGLGITSEFFESLLPMQSILYGFLGYKPKADHVTIEPNIPECLDFIKVTNIAWCGLVLDITACRRDRTIHIDVRGESDFKSIFQSKSYKIV